MKAASASGWRTTRRRPAPEFKLLHVTDYDPAGLMEYERLHRALGPRISLYQVPDLDEKFRRFSDRVLLQKPRSQSMLAVLQKSALPEVRQVVALINKHNAGLEQEALLFCS